MTQDQQTNEQQPKPKSFYPFAALMGIAAAVAAFALGIISTIPGMKWLSAVSFSGSHAMDWRLGLLNTYAAMHVKLVGSGMIDSGLGAEKVSASILMPPTLLTVGIGLLLFIALVILAKTPGAGVIQRLKSCLWALVVFGVLVAAISPMAKAKLDTVELPSTDEISFSAPAVDYGVRLIDAVGGRLPGIPALVVLIMMSVRPWKRTDDDMPRSDAAYAGVMFWSPIAKAAAASVAVFLLLAVGAGVLLTRSGLVKPTEAEPGGANQQVVGSIVPAATAGYLALHGVHINAKATGIYIPTNEVNTLLDFSAGLDFGTRSATNNGTDVKNSPIPRWVVLPVLLLWASVYFIVGRMACRPLRDVQARFESLTAKLLAVLVALVPLLTITFVADALSSRFVRVDGEMAKSVISISASPSWLLLVTIAVIWLAAYLGGSFAISRKHRNRQFGGVEVDK